LEKLHGALVGARADIAYCGWQNVGEGVTSEPYVPPPYEQTDAIEAFLRTTPWPIHAALVKKAVVDQLGGFSVSRFSSMDYDSGYVRSRSPAHRARARSTRLLSMARSNQVSAVSRGSAGRSCCSAGLHPGQSTTRSALAHASLARPDRGPGAETGVSRTVETDIASAHKLFRHVALARSFGFKELRHVASALLPLPRIPLVVGLRRNEP